MSVQEAAGAAVTSWDEARNRFAQILGQGEDLPPAVLHRAMYDSVFAHRLMVSRNAPKFMLALINDPANAKFADLAAQEADQAEEADRAAPAPLEQVQAPSTMALLGRATRSLAAWAATGFTHVDQATFDLRISQCSMCPHAKAAPGSALYRLAGGGKADPSVCGLCGCPVQRKARMATESCPGADPARPGYTRWGDPRKG